MELNLDTEGPFLQHILGQEGWQAERGKEAGWTWIMFPSVVLACDERHLLIYGTDSVASFTPKNLHVYCIFNPFIPGPLLRTQVTVDGNNVAVNLLQYRGEQELISWLIYKLIQGNWQADILIC